MRQQSFDGYTLGQFVFSLNDDVLRIQQDEQSFTLAAPQVRYQQGDEERSWSLPLAEIAWEYAPADLAEPRACLVGVAGNGEITATLVFSGNAGEESLTIDVAIAKAGQADIRLLAVTAVRMPLAQISTIQPARARFWVSPPDAWGKPGTIPVTQEPSPDDTSSRIGYWLGAVYDAETKACIAISHALPAQWADAITCDADACRVEALIDVPLLAGYAVRLDPVSLRFHARVDLALEACASAFPAFVKAQDARDHIGWNSWDYYYQEINEEIILENVRAIARNPELRDRIKYIIIDDGWQTATGDWEANEKFPNGMDGIAAKIREAGFVPGIWSAPFMIDSDSRLYAQHPDYAIQYQDAFYSPYKLIGCDPPWGLRGYMDPTNPGVREHIFNLYRKIHGWGYRYFKTDFLVNSIRPFLPGYEDLQNLQLDVKAFQYHDRSSGIQGFHRACMAAIRAAIGSESFWLGCGSCLNTGMGLMNASRIGADISVVHSALLQNTYSAAFHRHLHGQVWINDPDFAVFRGPETYDTQRFAPHDLTRKEPLFSCTDARVWATMLILSGGAIIFSEPMDGYTEAGRQIIRAILQHCGGPAAHPLDIEAGFPGIYYKRAGSHAYLGIINWRDDAVRTVDLARDLTRITLPAHAVVQDVWTGDSHTAGNLFPLTIAPGGVSLLTWKL